jgi:hypothetical protein
MPVHIPKIFKRKSTKDLKEKQAEDANHSEPVPDVPSLPTNFDRKLSLPILQLNTGSPLSSEFGVNGVASAPNSMGRNYSLPDIGYLGVPNGTAKALPVTPQTPGDRSAEIWTSVNTDQTTKGEKMLNKLGAAASMSSSALLLLYRALILFAF